MASQIDPERFSCYRRHLVHIMFQGSAMQLMRYDLLAEGPGPSEMVIAIATTDGKEEIVLHSSALVDRNRIEVGVIGYKDDTALIELPRESASGRWRVWVPRSALGAA